MHVMLEEGTLTSERFDKSPLADKPDLLDDAVVSYANSWNFSVFFFSPRLHLSVTKMSEISKRTYQSK